MSTSERLNAILAQPPNLLARPEDLRRKNLVCKMLFPGETERDRIDHFAILRQAGTGAMSTVYEAYDRKLDRKVAIKLLRSEIDLAHEARLEREARALAKVPHNNIVTVYGAGRWQGQLYLVEEFVDGCSLARWQTREARQWRQVVSMYLQAGRGLAAAHAAGLVHRDFKPANVMVGDDGRARVLDFGLVAALCTAASDREPEKRAHSPWAERSPARDLTQSGIVLGTPAYMAPEQVQCTHVDARADQFSFGIALWEALHGERPPFVSLQPSHMGSETRSSGLVALDKSLSSRTGQRPCGSSADAKSARKSRDRPVPRRLDRALCRALKAEPDDRWPSMEDLVRELTWIVETRQRRIRAFIVAGLLAILAGLVALSWSWNERRVATANARSNDMKLVATAGALLPTDPTAAAAVLRAVSQPNRVAGFTAVASAVLQQNISRTVDIAHNATVCEVVFASDGRSYATRSRDGTVRIWWTDGTSKSIALPLGASFALRIQISQDGERLLALTRDGQALVWTLASIGSPIRLSRNGEAIVGACFRDDGSRVATIASDGTANLWNLQDDSAPIVLGSPSKSTYGLWFRDCSPDGSHILFQRRDKSLLVVSVSDSSVSFEQSDDAVNAMAFDRRGDLLAIGHLDGMVELRSPGSGAHRARFQAHESTIRELALTPDGKRLVTVGEGNGVVREWRTRGDFTPIREYRHSTTPLSIDISPDGRWLLTSPAGSPPLVWDMETGNTIATLRGHSRTVAAAKFDPHGHTVVTGSLDGSVRSWDVTRRSIQVLRGHDSAIWALHVDEKHNRVATAGWDGQVGLWFLDEPGRSRMISAHPGRQVYTAVLGPAGDRLATGANDGSARIFQLTGGDSAIVFPGHEVWAYAVAFSPDGRAIATGSKRGVVRLWSAAGGEPVVLQSEPARKRYKVNALKFRPDGQHLAAALESGKVLVWRIDGPRTPRVLASHDDMAFHLAFSPDGRYLATASQDNTVDLWSSDGIRHIRTLTGHKSSVFHVAFSPQSDRIVTASADGTSRVWDIAGGDVPIVLHGHTDWVVTAEFSGSGRRVVTASYDHTARIWEVDDPENPIVLYGHDDKVRSAAFTRDDQVVTASFDTTVRLWPAPELESADELHERLNQITRVCLTVSQRIQHLAETAFEAHSRFDSCRRQAH